MSTSPSRRLLDDLPTFEGGFFLSQTHLQRLGQPAAHAIPDKIQSVFSHHFRRDIMDFSLWLSFFTVSLVLSAAPGPDNLFVLAQSSLYGVRAGILVVIGLCTGLVCQTLLAVLGISAVITAQPALMWVIRIAGAGYLLYLALGAYRSTKCTSVEEGKALALSPVKLWLRGWFMNMTNPKVLIFFLAFFPQFIPEGLSGWPLVLRMTIQGATFILATLIVFITVAVCAGKLADRMRSVRFQHVLGWVSTVIFVALAAATLFSV